MKNKILILFITLLISGCTAGSSNLRSVRIEKKEPPIGLSKQKPSDLINVLKNK